MLQIRIHGRGGQGVVTAAEMLSIAAFEQGRHAQAFPSFGSERTGAPVVAFCRIDDREIRLREPIVTPDVLIVQDPTLLHQVDVFQGLPANGYGDVSFPVTVYNETPGLGWHTKQGVDCYITVFGNKDEANGSASMCDISIQVRYWIIDGKRMVESEDAGVESPLGDSGFVQATASATSTFVF